MTDKDVRLEDCHHIFIGVAGAGMSAIAQYLAGRANRSVAVTGILYPERVTIRAISWRLGHSLLSAERGRISALTDLVVVSTAVEDTVPEVQKAKSLSIPILKRSELLALITDSRKTIAVGGTSGKSTTSAMLFHILREAGMSPSIISGAGLTSLIREGKIGNAWVGQGDWLVIEADESDKSIVQYHPEIGLLLNIDKDHQEIDELLQVFATFREHTKDRFIVNRSHMLTRGYRKMRPGIFPPPMNRQVLWPPDLSRKG